MSPLRCSTVKEAIWERAASAGPASLSPTLADHLVSCSECRAEQRAVREVLEVTRELADPEPSADIWDGFERKLREGIDRVGRIDRLGGMADSIGPRLRRWMGVAAVLAVGFGLGVIATRSEGEGPIALDSRREALLADIQAELRNDARLESYVTEIEDLLVTYRAVDHGDAVGTFQRSLPATMVAGPAIPSEGDRQRIEQQRAVREQLRSVVIEMLASEVEAESRGFDYIDRRIAAIAGQRLLFFVR